VVVAVLASNRLRFWGRLGRNTKLAVAVAVAASGNQSCRQFVYAGAAHSKRTSFAEAVATRHAGRTADKREARLKHLFGLNAERDSDLFRITEIGQQLSQLLAGTGNATGKGFGFLV
jgi:predicted flap endonuclease-1-like 5' DNA nuclease